MLFVKTGPWQLIVLLLSYILRRDLGLLGAAIQISRVLVQFKGMMKPCKGMGLRGMQKQDDGAEVTSREEEDEGSWCRN